MPFCAPRLAHTVTTNKQRTNTMSKEKISPEKIEWSEPPPRKWRKGSQWDLIADALRSNPGQWAKIVTNGDIAVATQAERGELVCFRPAGSFEKRTIVTGESRWTGDVWLRYIGENGEYAGEDE